jgi:SMC interacting uncharacterized protein involved in chromosome segregation
MEKEPTNKEILGAVDKLGEKMEKSIERLDKKIEESFGELHEAMSVFAENVDERFDKVDKRFEKMDSRMDSMEGHMDSMEGRMDSMESKIVTKDYLDEKLFDLRGDLLTVIKKEDHKVDTLIEILYKKDILNRKDKESILKIELFPKMA